MAVWRFAMVLWYRFFVQTKWGAVWGGHERRWVKRLDTPPKPNPTCLQKMVSRVPLSNRQPTCDDGQCCFAAVSNYLSELGGAPTSRRDGVRGTVGLQTGRERLAHRIAWGACDDCRS